jgi:hypothetical protein
MVSFFVLGGLALFVAARPALADNPEDATVPMNYIYHDPKTNQDIPLQGATVIPADSSHHVGQYTPSHPGWDNCYTLFGHSKYHHGHYPVAYVPFPRYDVINGHSVTMDMVNAYYDALYKSKYTYWDRMSQPTFDYNCHGYSTGLALWLYPDADGIDVVLAHDWYTIKKPQPQSICASTEHSYQISEIYINTKMIKMRLEKSGESGVYLILFSYPGYSPEYPIYLCRY